MSNGPRARDNIYVLGIGHPLRRDDRVGLELVERLAAHFTGGFHGQAIYEMDVGLSETLAGYEHLLVIDAAVPGSITTPYATFPLATKETDSFPSGFLTHIFDWGFLLGITLELHGKAPKAELVAVATEDCGIGEALSNTCAQHADAAYSHLLAVLIN